MSIYCATIYELKLILFILKDKLALDNAVVLLTNSHQLCNITLHLSIQYLLFTVSPIASVVLEIVRTLVY